jgi:hypothetical protein
VNNIYAKLKINNRKDLDRYNSLIKKTTTWLAEPGALQ